MIRANILRRGLTRALSGKAPAAPVPAVLPDLPYAYGALEPAISGTIMEVHHTKHHAAYVNNFNIAAGKLHAAAQAGDVPGQLAALPAVRFHGGGHVNHCLWWEGLAPVADGGGTPPQAGSPLALAIDRDFGGLDNFKSIFAARTAAVQGSGWGWLGLDADTGRLQITTCANQDTVAERGLVPLLGVDVWEHAVWLDYKSDRATYIKNLWTITNWAEVSRRFDAALKK
eukprot:TRINITY_DN2160_c0_g1_i5.p2 TRINITY_DN2160_c0_g1~~TRINITY_DN2160_c0_g1_i5.p2  ORF type:complete len:228 (-),score=109.67 TRINITY_DN2160_c0_g1_i5:78-761(-)